MTGGGIWSKILSMKNALCIILSILYALLFAGLWRYSYAGIAVAAGLCLGFAALFCLARLKLRAIPAKAQTASLLIWTGVLFLCFLAAGLYMSVEPYSDWAALYSGAKEVLKSGSLKESGETLYYYRDNKILLHEYFLVYPHNIFPMLYLAGFFALFSASLRTGIALSALSLALAVLFAALAARKARGFRAALIVMLFGTAFLPFYLNAHRFYTDTLCLPWFSLFVWQYARMTEGEKGAALLAAAALAVAAMLRMNLLIFAVAVVLALPISSRGFRRALPRLAVFAALLLLLVGGGTLAAERGGAVDSAALAEQRFPKTHWLMMASTGDGGYRQEDFEFTRAAENKAQATREEYRRRVGDYGSLGEYLRFMARKLLTACSDGTMTQQNHLRLSNIGALGNLVLPEGRYYPLFLLYIRTLYMLMYALLPVCVIAGIWKKNCGAELMLYAGFIGTLIFFAFWELKSRYLLPLAPVYFILAALSADYLAEKGNEKWKKFAKLPRRR